MTNLMLLQIKDWFSKVENAREVAKRPAPSYMNFQDGQDEYQVSVIWLQSPLHRDTCSASLSNVGPDHS